MNTISQDLWNKLTKIQNIESLDQIIVLRIISTVLNHHQVDRLMAIKNQSEADDMALSCELGYAGKWALNLPPPSRVVKDFIDKFKEYKKTLEELISVTKDLQEDNNTLTEQNARLTHSRDAAWKSFHAVNDELIPMREQMKKCVKVEQDCERYREEKEALQAENYHIKIQYQNDINQRIAIISEMQKQLNALTERVLALKINMH